MIGWWAVVASATPASRVTVSTGLEPMPVFSTSFESTVGSRGVVVHGGVGGLFVLLAAALEANVGVRLTLPGDLVRPDFGVRLGIGGAAAWTVGSWGYTHVDALGGVRIGRGTALDLRAGPMLVVGWLGVDRPLPGLVCQVGVSIPFGPDPKAYEAGGAVLADHFREDGVVVHAGVGGLFVLYAAAFDANLGVRLVVPGWCARWACRGGSDPTPIATRPVGRSSPTLCGPSQPRTSPIPSTWPTPRSPPDASGSLRCAGTPT